MQLGTTLHYLGRLDLSVIGLNSTVLNPIPARLLELHKGPGGGRFALPVVNCQKKIQTSAKPKKKILCIFEIFG